MRNLAIKNNSANRGGGIYANSSSLIVENCIFSDNEAVDYGGAFHRHGGSPTIKNSIIHNNTHTGSSWNGGGLSFFAGSDALALESTIFTPTEAPRLASWVPPFSSTTPPNALP